MISNRAVGIIAATALLGASGCSSETKAEEEASLKCPSFDARASGECKTVQGAEKAKKREEIEKEAHESEDVLRKRHAEELANKAEGRE